MDLEELRRLVRKGEGSYLEFKRKARHPDKIAREMLAFANSEGGLLLIGVDDDLSIHGVKFPDEDIYAIETFLNKYTYPEIPYRLEKINVTASRHILAYHIEESQRKPHFMRALQEDGKKQAFVRVNDMSITASREMIQVLRNERRNRGVHLRLGEREKGILEYLDKKSSITLRETQQHFKLNKRKASTLLILLVRAGLLNIHPSEKGDFYSLAEEAFQ